MHDEDRRIGDDDDCRLRVVSELTSSSDDLLCDGLDGSGDGTTVDVVVVLVAAFLELPELILS
jgi:hypothetical protein